MFGYLRGKSKFLDRDKCHFYIFGAVTDDYLAPIMVGKTLCQPVCVIKKTPHPVYPDSPRLQLNRFLQVKELQAVIVVTR